MPFLHPNEHCKRKRVATIFNTPAKKLRIQPTSIKFPEIPLNVDFRENNSIPGDVAQPFGNPQMRQEIIEPGRVNPKRTGMGGGRLDHKISRWISKKYCAKRWPRKDTPAKTPTQKIAKYICQSSKDHPANKQFGSGPNQAKPPGHALRRKYGTVGAGYYSTSMYDGKTLRMKQISAQAAKAVTSTLLPKVVKRLKIKTNLKKLKTAVFNDLKRDMSAKAYNKAGNKLVNHFIQTKKKAVTEKGKPHVTKLGNLLGKTMHAYATELKQAGGKKKQHEKNKKKHHSNYWKEFYRGFALVMKPSLKYIIAPAFTLAGMVVPPLEIGAVAAETVGNIMPDGK